MSFGFVCFLSLSVNLKIELFNFAVCAKFSAPVSLHCLPTPCTVHTHKSGYGYYVPYNEQVRHFFWENNAFNQKQHQLSHKMKTRLNFHEAGKHSVHTVSTNTQQSRTCQRSWHTVTGTRRNEPSIYVHVPRCVCVFCCYSERNFR